MTNAKQMIQTLFPKTAESVVNEVIKILSEEGQKFALDTNLRLGHFFAQVREEVGDELKSVSENLNYSASVLPNKFDQFKGATGEALAQQYGRIDGKQKANQEMIASIAYSNKYGNGSVESRDGWNYRGRGMLQLTWKANYEEVQKRIDKYSPGSGINIVKNNDDINTLRGALLSAAGFWIWKDVYKAADKGTDQAAVLAVTDIINKWTDSKNKRWAHFQKISALCV